MSQKQSLQSLIFKLSDCIGCSPAELQNRKGESLHSFGLSDFDIVHFVSLMEDAYDDIQIPYPDLKRILDGTVEDLMEVFQKAGLDNWDFTSEACTEEIDDPAKKSVNLWEGLYF